MTPLKYATVDEQGRMILPEEFTTAWSLEPGSRLPIAVGGEALQLHPPVTSLRRVYIELTNACNLKCRTCMRNSWVVETGRMSPATFERVLSDVQALQPHPELFFGGYGEALAHPDCLDWIAETKARGIKVSLITNGTLLTEEAAARLIDLQLDMLWVSLDGASPQSYLDVRLKDALPEILDNLRRLRRMLIQRLGDASWAARPRLGIAFVAMQRNLSDLLPVIEVGIRLGALEFSISNLLVHSPELRAESLYTRALNQTRTAAERRWKPLIHLPALDITPESVTVLAELISSDQRLSMSGSEIGKNGSRCPFVERGSVSVRWDGKVSPCLPLLYSHTHYLDPRPRVASAYFVGDVHTAHLGAIWGQEAYVSLRKLLEDFDFSPCVACNSCEMAEHNLEDCYGNVHPTCGGCLWAQGLLRCP
jgi:MoaA/NifB/PqqE/SkfB family radical SAM enzyme